MQGWTFKLKVNSGRQQLHWDLNVERFREYIYIDYMTLGYPMVWSAQPQCTKHLLPFTFFTDSLVVPVFVISTRHNIDMNDVISM